MNRTFSIKEKAARECATNPLEEVALLFELSLKIISNNGAQFSSAVMKLLCYTLKIDQQFTPAEHPQSNPVYRKNADLKSPLAIFIGNNHQA